MALFPDFSEQNNLKFQNTSLKLQDQILIMVMSKIGLQVMVRKSNLEKSLVGWNI